MGCGCGKKNSSLSVKVQPKQTIKKTPITPSKRIIRRTAK